MEKRIMLIGEMGKGKSATGNSLIGMLFFKTGSSFNSVTKRYRRYKGRSEPADQDLVIIDTPGFFSNDSPFSERALEIQQYLINKPSKAPHVFLLVFSLARDPFLHNRDTINMLHILFGEPVFEHCIVVFTHADAIKTDEEFERYWQTDDVLKEVVGKCGGRVTRIENRFDNVDARIGILIKEIESLSQSGESTYKYPGITQHKIFLENLQDADDKTIGQVAIELEAFLAEKKTMRYLKYTGVVLGIGLIAAGGTKLTSHFASKGADLVKNKIGETAAVAAKHFVDQNLPNIVQPLLPKPEQIRETATAAAKHFVDKNLPNIVQPLLPKPEQISKTATAAAKQFVDQTLPTIGHQIAQQVEIKVKRNQGGCVVM